MNERLFLNQYTTGLRGDFFSTQLDHLSVSKLLCICVINYCYFFSDTLPVNLLHRNANV